MAQGGGPFGVRIGEGPGGWAVTLGDMANAYVKMQHQKALTDKLVKSLGGSAKARGDYAVEDAKAQGLDFVPQGTPLSFGE